MSVRRFVIIVILVALNNILLSQNKKELIELGDLAFKNGNYASAAYFYSRITESSKFKNEETVFPYEVKYGKGKFSKKEVDGSNFNSPNNINNLKSTDAYVVNMLAESYRRNNDYIKAELWYEKAVQMNDPQFPKARLYYAATLMQNGKYDQALEQIDIFRKNSTQTDEETDRFANLLIGGCYLNKNSELNHTEVGLRMLDSLINAGTSSFALQFYGNEKEYIFSSGRKENTINDPKKQNPVFLSDLYKIEINDKFRLSNIENLGLPINSDQIEGSASMPADRSVIFFSRKDPLTGEIAIYASKFFADKWLQPMKLGNKVNVEGFVSAYPYVSLDGEWLFFSSNRPGGMGGMDIWYCKIGEYGSLSDPVNLGPPVNTPGDEVAPFFHYNTKTLFFSSDGHPSYGNKDIFRSMFSEEDSVWSLPQNIGKPYNSPKEDLYFILSKDQKFGFLTSDRNPCENCDENYLGTNFCYRIYGFTKPELKFSISGVVYNAETNDPIPNALVTFKDVDGNLEPFFITTNENGEYRAELGHNWELFIKAQKKKFFGDAAAVSTKGLTESQHFIQDFYLSPIPAGEIELPGIEYDFDKATLRPESKKILDDLIEFLKLNDNLVIEIRSHTDSRGSESYNLRLSNARAKSVVDYLVAHGIPRDRLYPIGLGESEPLIPDSEIEKMATEQEKEEAHQRNRRTAFKPISQDYQKVFKNK